jgi:putative sterol carrier protein
MSTGKLNPQLAFMTGKIKLKGDMALAMKMAQIFKQ